MGGPFTRQTFSTVFVASHFQKAIITSAHLSTSCLPFCLYKVVAVLNKNVDIKFGAHDAFLEYPSSGTLKIERLECQIFLGAIKPTGQNRIAKIGKGHLYLRNISIFK